MNPTPQLESVVNQRFSQTIDRLFSKKKRENLPAKDPSTQGWRNCTLIGHERRNIRFLVLPGSLSVFTEITEYTYFSLT